MRKRSTTDVAGDPRREPPGTTDWAALRRMTDAEVLAGAESDPDALPVTPERAPTFRPISRVKRIRERLGMSQPEFSEAFGIPVGTLRDWEQHRSEPEGAAATLVRAIETEPETMLRLLRVAA